MIKAVARGIPADIAVRLRKATVTATVVDAVSLHLQIRFLRSLCEVTTGVPSPQRGKAILMNQSLFNRDI